MKRNRRLLLKTAKRIEEVPESYDQSEWGTENDLSPCGTVSCLAGEIIIASEPDVKAGVGKLFKAMRSDGYVSGAACELAGLTPGEAENLFYDPRDWPNKIGSRFYQKKQAGRAKAAATLLRYLADGGEV